MPRRDTHRPLELPPLELLDSPKIRKAAEEYRRLSAELTVGLQPPHDP